MYDALTTTSDVEEIRDQQRKRNEFPGIHRPNRHVCAVKPRDAIGGKKEEPALIVVS